MSGVAPFLVPPQGGEALWYRGTLMTVKVPSERTGGALTVIEHALPAGFGAPLHVHHSEDEPWYVLEGRVRFFCQEQTFEAEPGSLIFLPRDVPHSFRVDEAGPARMLLVGIPGGIEGFFTELGDPAPERVFPPPPGPPDMEQLRSVGRKYGLEFPVGPTPQ